MTTERFSLLPARFALRIAERRWMRFTAGALVVVLGVLVLVGLSQGRRLRQAEKAREEAWLGCLRDAATRG